MNQSRSDEDWLLFGKFQKGDLDAFHELFNKHKRNVINLSYRFVRNKETAEDIAQDVFIKIYEKKVKFDPKAKFSTWLYKVTVNASIDRTRKKSFFDRSFDKVQTGEKGEGKTLLETLSDPSAISPADVVASEEIKNLVRMEIQKLPEKLKTTILLHQFEDLSYKEIACILGITTKAVERKIYHAKEILHKKLSKYFSYLDVQHLR